MVVPINHRLAENRQRWSTAISTISFCRQLNWRRPKLRSWISEFRATGFSSRRDGYVDDIAFGDNAIYDRNRWGIRLQGLYTPTDALSVRVIADYSEIDEVCCAALTTQDNLRPVHTHKMAN